MLPNELALIAVLIGVSARQLSRAQHFQEVIHSVLERKREKSREKEAGLFDFAHSSLVPLVLPQVVVVRFPGVKIAKNPPHSEA